MIIWIIVAIIAILLIVQLLKAVGKILLKVLGILLTIAAVITIIVLIVNGAKKLDTFLLSRFGHGLLYYSIIVIGIIFTLLLVCVIINAIRRSNARRNEMKLNEFLNTKCNMLGLVNKGDFFMRLRPQWGNRRYLTKFNVVCDQFIKSCNHKVCQSIYFPVYEQVRTLGGMADIEQISKQNFTEFKMTRSITNIELISYILDEAVKSGLLETADVATATRGKLYKLLEKDYDSSTMSETFDANDLGL